MTQKEVSENLGIGQSAVANYEQGLRFPDAVILKSISKLFGVSIDFLLGNGRKDDITYISISAPEEPLSDTTPRLYRDLLLQNRSAEALDLLSSELKKGRSLDELLTGVLIPTLHHTGELWEAGRIGIAEEHAISEDIERMAGILAFLSPRRAPLNARCICASAGPEMHSIGTRMVSDLLAADGWDSLFLGVHTPARDLLKLCTSLRSDLLVLSATLDRHIEAVKHIIEAVRSKLDVSKCGILVGGGAFLRNPKAWEAAGADLFARDIPEAVRMAREFIEKRRGLTS